MQGNQSPIEPTSHSTIFLEVMLSANIHPERRIMPAGMPQFNKRFVNPLLRKLAPRMPSAAVVVHVGRRTGRQYRTPVLALRTGNSFAIPLPYGNRTDWSRNLRAAGGGVLVRMNKRIIVTNPRIVDSGEREQIPGPLRRLARRIDVLLVDVEPR